MGAGFVELKIVTGVDRDELAALVSGSGCLGGWEDEDALHLYWLHDSWGPEIVDLVRNAVLQLGGAADTVIDTSEVPDRDWNARWASSTRPLLIGGRVLVRQSWTAAPLPPAWVELVIDPKRAFGTGFHATTQLAVEWLLDSIRGGESVLDAGTGSAILAMTALRLGAARAVGIDSDPEAVDCARENALSNGFGPELEIQEAGIETWDRTGFDIVLANIDRNTLLRHANTLGGCVGAGGRILVTGIQEEDSAEIEAAFGAAGFGVAGRRGRDEWLALELILSSNRTAMQLTGKKPPDPDRHPTSSDGGT